MHGVPGTGKTAYARWLAAEMNRPLLVKRASDIISMWVGGTEKNLAHAFAQAEREHAVLLRKNRITPIQCAEDIVTILEQECALKEDGGNKRMGFV